MQACPTPVPRSADDPPGLIGDRDLALRWKKSVRTLQRWRAEGYGPAWIRIGGTLHYRWADVLAFEERQRVTGRSDR